MSAFRCNIKSYEIMKFRLISIFLAFYGLTLKSQNDTKPTLLDTSLAKKISVSGFCLCQTSLSTLYNLSNDFKSIKVEEMNLSSNCVSEDSRFEKGKGYYSAKYPGLIFSKHQTTDEI